MKIAFVVQDMCGQGVQYSTAMMARAFVAKGWDFDLVVSKVHDDYVKAGATAFKVPSQVNWVRLPNRRARQNILALRRYVRYSGADIIVVQSELYRAAIRLAMIGMWFIQKPKIYEVYHGVIWPGSTVWWKKMRERIVNWLVYSKFSGVMVVNKQSEKNLRMKCSLCRHLPISTVYNAVVDDEFKKYFKMPPQHPWLKNKVCPTFVTAGSYTYGKCHLMLMDAFRIANKIQKVRLVVYGSGCMEGDYNDYIAQHHLEDVISVAGFTNQLPAEICASDGLVSASIEESFGITLVEGLACHKPVISTDAPMGPREILEDGKYGRLLPVNDPDEMAMAILDCADGKMPAADDESWQRYTIERISQRYFNALGIK